MEVGHGGGQNSHRVVAPVKEKEEKKLQAVLNK
jgi:hypothetical protein